MTEKQTRPASESPIWGEVISGEGITISKPNETVIWPPKDKAKDSKTR